MEERNLPDGFCKGFSEGRDVTKESEERVVRATRTNVSRNGEVIREKAEAKSSLKTTQKKK